MEILLRMIAGSIEVFSKLKRRALIIIYRPYFKRTGKNFVFDPYGLYTFKNIEVGDDVYIGPGAKLMCTKSKIILGSKIMFGPNVSLLAGDHNTEELGMYMYDQKIKLPKNDSPIIINDDVWLSAGVTVLKGVTIGRGCIVAAGAIVTNDLPPYSISAGIPAKVQKYRFSPEDIIVHENLLKSKILK